MHYKYAMITGASAGIGKYLALECAQAGWKIVLVSLPGTGIEHVARIIRFRYDREVHIIETDLSDPDSAIPGIINGFSKLLMTIIPASLSLQMLYVKYRSRLAS